MGTMIDLSSKQLQVSEYLSIKLRCFFKKHFLRVQAPVGDDSIPKS